MINYVIFLAFTIFTFLLSHLTLRAEKEKLQIIKNSKKILVFVSIYFLIFLMIIAYSIFSGKIKNLLGIDFVGGTLTEIIISTDVTDQQIRDVYKKYNVDPTIQNVILEEKLENKRLIVIKTKPIEEIQKNKINKELQGLGAEIRRTENVSSTIGKETLINAVIALIIALIAQVIYIAIRFGNNILYGIIADIGLLHDFTVMLGVYITLGMLGFAGFEINTIFLAAALTVIGYSVMDSIVIFDRIRENLKIEIKQNQKISLEKFDIIINNSIIQTLVRSVFTSMTLLLTLWGIVFLGGETLRSFAIALSVGTLSGTFSSIFIAAPLVSIFKNKILPKDIQLLTEEKPPKVESLTQNIMSIFAHQQEEEIINKPNTTPQHDQLTKEKRKIKERYLKSRIVKRNNKEQG
ncbi:MAG: protein translocase subunit SecF [Candidatus Calescibacterium sp.]|nr:protein translocase subunit SecF [Candidatus Calescibacterium sp.]MDW8195884.1 protein translocase subunit SecF [Candidatus Calescibacterium sp.]